MPSHFVDRVSHLLRRLLAPSDAVALSGFCLGEHPRDQACPAPTDRMTDIDRSNNKLVSSIAVH